MASDGMQWNKVIQIKDVFSGVQKNSDFVVTFVSCVTGA